MGMIVEIWAAARFLWLNWKTRKLLKETRKELALTGR
jgi:hypothetical protein